MIKKAFKALSELFRGELAFANDVSALVVGRREAAS